MTSSIANFDVPAVTTVDAAVSDDIAGFEPLVGRIGDEPAPASAINTNDSFGRTHEVTVPCWATLVCMRVVAGTLGGRRINAGDSETIRPTADRVREAMFNSLYSIGAITDAVVLDLFAGSGALGIEALSRGAARAVFVENDRQALKILRENLASLGLADQATVVPADGSTFLAHAEPYDLLVAGSPVFIRLLAGTARSPDRFGRRHRIGTVKSICPKRGILIGVRRYGGTVVTLAFAPAARKTQVP